MRHFVGLTTLAAVLTTCAGEIECPADTVLMNGVCIAETPCGSGTVKLNGSCVAQPTDAGTNSSCGPGTALVGSICVVVPVDGGVVCGAGTTQIGGQCLVDDAGFSCGVGTVLINGKCEALPHDGGVICGAGTIRSGDLCISAPVDGGVVCGPGTVLVQGACLAAVDVPPANWRKISDVPALAGEVFLSPNNRFVLFAPAIMDGGFSAGFVAADFRVIPLDGGVARDIAATSSFACKQIGVSLACTPPSQVVFSDDGRWLLMTNGAEVALFDLENATATPYSNVLSMIMSADGQRLAWVQRSGATSSVRLRQLPSTAESTLRTMTTSGIGDSLRFGQIDGGLSLFHVRQLGSLQSELSALPLDGGVPRLLASNVSLVGQASSGRLILEASGTTTITSVDADGTNARTLADAGFASLSPGGSRLLLFDVAEGLTYFTDPSGLAPRVTADISGALGWESESVVTHLPIDRSRVERVDTVTGTVTSLGAPAEIPNSKVHLEARAQGTYVEACLAAFNTPLKVNGMSRANTEISFCPVAGKVYRPGQAPASVPTMNGRASLSFNTNGFVSSGRGAVDSALSYGIANVVGLDAVGEFVPAAGLYVMPLP